MDHYSFTFSAFASTLLVTRYCIPNNPFIPYSNNLYVFYNKSKLQKILSNRVVCIAIFKNHNSAENRRGKSHVMLKIMPSWRTGNSKDSDI